MLIELYAPGKHFDGWRMEFDWDRPRPVLEIPSANAMAIATAINLGAKMKDIPDDALIAARYRFERSERRTSDGLPVYELVE